MSDRDLDAPGPDELIDLLRHEVDLLNAQLAALQGGDLERHLADEVRRRFGLQRRLDQELARVLELTDLMEVRAHTARRQRGQLLELMALLGVSDPRDLAPRLRALLDGRA